MMGAKTVSKAEATYKREIQRLRRRPEWISKAKFEAMVKQRLREVGVDSFVYDAIGLCKELGLEVIWHDLKDPRLKGYLLPTEPPAVVLDAKRRGLPAQQFDCMHELIHHWFHLVDGSEDEDTIRIYELQANWGARAAKMPRDLFIKAYNETDGDIAALAKRFNISLHPVVYRAFDLGLLTPEAILYNINLCTNTDLEPYLGPRKLYPPSVYRAALKGQGIIDVVDEVMSKGYLLIKTDERGRIMQCPYCGNEQFSPEARYCKRCGFPLYNNCTNLPERGPVYCGEINPPDAAFCEQCGHPTLFNKWGVVKPSPKIDVELYFNEDEIPPF